LHDERDSERSKDNKVREKYRTQKERSLSRSRSRSPAYRQIRISCRNNNFSKDIFRCQNYTTQELSKMIKNVEKYTNVQKTRSGSKSPKRSKHSSKKKKEKDHHLEIVIKEEKDLGKGKMIKTEMIKTEMIEIRRVVEIKV